MCRGTVMACATQHSGWRFGLSSSSGCPFWAIKFQSYWQQPVLYQPGAFNILRSKSYNQRLVHLHCCPMTWATPGWYPNRVHICQRVPALASTGGDAAAFSGTAMRASTFDALSLRTSHGRMKTAPSIRAAFPWGKLSKAFNGQRCSSGT